MNEAMLKIRANIVEVVLTALFGSVYLMTIGMIIYMVSRMFTP